MKRLGLALLIATFVFLMIGQAIADPVEIIQTFVPGGVDPYQGTMRYDVTNNSTGIVFQLILWYKNADFIPPFDSGVVDFATTALPSSDWSSNDINLPSYKLSLNWTNMALTGILPGDTVRFEGVVSFAGGIIPSSIPSILFDSNSTTGPFSGQTTTPEPSTLLLLGFGLIAVAGYTTLLL
jgi:hypothetical protein